MDAPKIVTDLAASVSGIPMKWREQDNQWVIILTDGRKYRFPKDTEGKPRAQETKADYKAPVDVTPNPDKPHRKTKETP